MTFGVVMKIFGKFAYLLIVSLLMGLIFGLLSALLLKKYNVSSAPQVINILLTIQLAPLQCVVKDPFFVWSSRGSVLNHRIGDGSRLG